MDNLSWEEKYLRLRTEKDELSKKATEQDASIRQMRTKFAKLESLLKQRARTDGGGPVSSLDLGDGSVVGARRADKDNEALVTDLYKRNATLQRDNKAMESRYKALATVAARLKRELQLARRRGGTATAAKAGSGPASSAAGDEDDELLAPARGDGTLGSAKLADLVEKLRHRLINAEKQLGKLRDENQRLRSGKPAGPMGDEMDSTMAAARSAKWTSSTAEGEEVRPFFILSWITHLGGGGAILLCRVRLFPHTLTLPFLHNTHTPPPTLPPPPPPHEK